MISVVIPAHNEAAVIGRSLAALLTGAVPGELDIIVVCNGCSDETASVARQFGAPVSVVETSVASKIHALNLGDREASSFPRVYLDADVILPLDSLRRVAEPLHNGVALAAGPVPHFETANCSWAVRAFYRINELLPSSREGIGGSGAYAMSAAGRNRFAEFPDVIGDDGFARLLFSPAERVAVAGAICTVFAPRTLQSLIAIKTRSHLGNYQLAQRFPELQINRPKANKKALPKLFLSPRLWPALAVYSYVKFQARRRARQNLAALGHKRWTWIRDDTSRDPDPQQKLQASIQHVG